MERVASGSGLVNVYDFLSRKFPDRVDKAVDDGERAALEMLLLLLLLLVCMLYFCLHIEPHPET